MKIDILKETLTSLGYNCIDFPIVRFSNGDLMCVWTPAGFLVPSCRCLVRQYNSEKWRFREHLIGSDVCGYVTDMGTYHQCLPFNSQTWKLLNTSNNYDE